MDYRYQATVTRLRAFEDMMQPFIDKWCDKVVEEIIDMQSAQNAVNLYNVDWFAQFPFNIKIKQKMARALSQAITPYSPELASWYDAIVDGNPDSLEIIDFKTDENGEQQ